MCVWKVLAGGGGWWWWGQLALRLQPSFIPARPCGSEGLSFSQCCCFVTLIGILGRVQLPLLPHVLYMQTIDEAEGTEDVWTSCLGPAGTAVCVADKAVAKLDL